MLLPKRVKNKRFFSFLFILSSFLAFLFLFRPNPTFAYITYDGTEEMSCDKSIGCFLSAPGINPCSVIRELQENYRCVPYIFENSCMATDPETRQYCVGECCRPVTCGDFVCEGSETYLTCPQDCPAPPTPTLVPISCSGYTSCGSCINDPSCGWTGTNCESGSLSCPAGYSYWYWNSCSINECYIAPTPTPTPKPDQCNPPGAQGSACVTQTCPNGNACATGHQYCVYSSTGNYWGSCTEEVNNCSTQCAVPPPYPTK